MVFDGSVGSDLHTCSARSVSMGAWLLLFGHALMRLCGRLLQLFLGVGIVAQLQDGKL